LQPSSDVNKHLCEVGVNMLGISGGM